MKTIFQQTIKLWRTQTPPRNAIVTAVASIEAGHSITTHVLALVANKAEKT